MRTMAVTVGVLLLVGCAKQPEPGAERGRCRPQGACNAGLTCISDVCVKVPEDRRARQQPKAVPAPPLGEQALVTAKRLLKEARVAYIRGKHQQAAELAGQVLKLHPDNGAATQILGASSCYLKDVAQARRAHDRLPGPAQKLLQQTCLRVGINLGQ